MLQNALDLTVSRQDAETAADSTLPVWAQTAVTTLADNGFALDAEAVLTRGDAAQVLYQAAKMNSKSVFSE